MGRSASGAAAAGSNRDDMGTSKLWRSLGNLQVLDWTGVPNGIRRKAFPGEVYRATDTNLKRQVALKVLPEILATDPDRLARLQGEAEVLASLNHPHIAQIYGVEKAGGTLALVMELVEGQRSQIALPKAPGEGDGV
jgi:Protein kinase domain